MACRDDELVVDPEPPFSVLEGADDLMYEYLHHPWELHLQLPTGVLLGAEPDNAGAFAQHDGGWLNTAGVSSSSSSSSPVTFDVHIAAWVDDSSTGQLSLSAGHGERSGASNLFSFEGGGSSVDASTAATKRPRARAASQHGAVQEEEEEAASTVTEKKCGGGKRAAAKRAKAAATVTPPKEPQKSAAKNRRERVNERLKVLQELVPNGNKVDTVTMLDKAITYVKFMQLQLKVLETDAFWPTQGGKAPEMSQVKEALDAILFSPSSLSQYM